MENAVQNFGQRIAELRKKSGQSQKLAAEKLEISQALLSHYEKGVRECGLEFILRASKYYGVSCDYLLGNSNNTLALENFEDIKNIPEDKEMSLETLYRTGLFLTKKCMKDFKTKEYIIQLYNVSNYILLRIGAEKGLLPKSWLTHPKNEKQLQFLYTTTFAHIFKENEKIENKGKDKPPFCILTTNEWIDNYFNISVAELM